MSAHLIHIVDDDAAIRDSLGFLLTTADYAVRVYASAAELLARASILEAGCIVTDVRMPGMSGLDLVRELKKIGIAHPVIVLTGHADVALAVEAMKAGVVDFLEKPVEAGALLRAVHMACVQSKSQDGDRADIARRAALLTAREHDVFHAIASGDSNKMAAVKLGISPRTVEIYRAHVMEKMQAATLSDLVRMAMKLDS